jgi:hypothetical protein
LGPGASRVAVSDFDPGGYFVETDLVTTYVPDDVQVAQDFDVQGTGDWHSQDWDAQQGWLQANENWMASNAVDILAAQEIDAAQAAEAPSSQNYETHVDWLQSETSHQLTQDYQDQLTWLDEDLRDQLSQSPISSQNEIVENVRDQLSHEALNQQDVSQNEQRDYGLQESQMNEHTVQQADRDQTWQDSVTQQQDSLDQTNRESDNLGTSPTITSGEDYTPDHSHLPFDPLSLTSDMSVVDMSDFETGRDFNALGFVRDHEQFWNTILEADVQRDEADRILSDENVARVLTGIAPTVDDVWIDHHPGSASYRDDVLVHHHWDYGPMAVAIPQTVHQEYSGDLHWR